MRGETERREAAKAAGRPAKMGKTTSPHFPRLEAEAKAGMAAKGAAASWAVSRKVEAGGPLSAKAA
jgi:hypothetical protein